MKICHLYNYPARYREEIFTLLDNEYESTFIFGDECPSVKRMDTSKLKKVHNHRFIYFGNIVYQEGVLNFLFKPFDIYIISTLTNNITYWIYLLYLKLFTRKKTYIWSHGFYGNETKRQIFIKKLYFGLANGVFVYGNYSRELMIKAGFRKEKLHVIYNSVHYFQQYQIRKKIKESDIYKSHFHNNHPTLVMIGRLNIRKQLALLLEAVERLKKAGNYVNLALIGDGEDRAILEEMAKSKKIEKQVWFYGASYDEEKNAELLYNASLCVVPGDIGLTAIHSMMFGCPCITHDYFPTQGPEFEAIIEGETGVFFKNNDVADLCDKIQSWIQEHQDDRESIRRNCYAEIDTKWNPINQIEIFRKVLTSK